MMHLSWNIGKAFSKKRIHIANLLRMSLLKSSETWESQLLSVRCHILELTAILIYAYH